jgi:hypothetical protein
MRAAAAILAAAAVSGCAERGSGSGAPKTGVEWLDRENAPVNVRLAFDSASAASETIGEAGGTISATGSDGSYFQLEIPKGALHRRERITMIPVSRVDGLPLENGGAVATVQLEPEGLRFDKPVKLTIEPAQPVPVNEQVGFAWIAQGTDTHLYPASGDSLAMEMHLLHFSGYGFGKAPPSDPGRIHLLYASAHAARLEAELANAIAAVKRADPLGEKNDSPENQNFLSAFYKVSLEYYDGIIAPTMKIAEQDDRMAECAFTFYLGWLRQLQLMGAAPDNAVGMIGDDSPDVEAYKQNPELVKRMAEASMSAARIIDNVEAHLMERAEKGCRQHDLTAYSRVFGIYRQFQLLGIEGKRDEANTGTLIEKMNDQCNRWEVELSSSVDSRLPSGAWHFTLMSTAKYAPTDGRLEAPLNYASLEISGRPWKDVMDAMSGGKGASLLAKRPGNFLRMMDFTVSRRGSRHGTVTVEKVLWAVVERDTVGTSCGGRDEAQKAQVADSMDVILRIDPPTEIVHFVGGAAPPHDEDMHEWMRFFMQFREKAGHEPAFVPEADRSDDSGGQPEFITVRVKQQSPGVWSADFRTPEGVTSQGLSETGHLILRHTPK